MIRGARKFIGTRIAGVTLGGLLSSACTSHPLEPLEQASNVVVAYGAVDAHFCTDVPAAARQKLKYLFVLDHSASNQPGFPLSAGDVSATDIQGSRRYGQLVNFVSNLVDDANTPTSFAAIDFNDDANQPNGLDGFTADKADFVQKITTDWIGGGTAQAPAPDDHGFTNYQDALHVAQQMIIKDAQQEAALLLTPPVKTSYVIIFVSDGVPTIATAGNTSTLYTQTFNDDIAPALDAILDLRNDLTLGPLIANITLNSAYYHDGTEILAARTLLTQMAQAGNGQYLQFNSGANILYQQFAPPSRNIRNQLVDVFVQNENAVWWNGAFLPDTDGDGLPDLVEAQQRSNARAGDSDGNGVGDLVEYRTKGRACDADGCAPAGRDAYAICSGFIAGTDADGRISYRSSTNDGLNDCEKFLLGADRTSYNSNGSLIPDDLAFKASLPIIPGSRDAAFADPFTDGMQNYAKLKLGLPLQVSRQSIGPDFENRGLRLDREASADPSVECYHFVATNLAMSGETNVVRVMIVQNSSALQDKPFLKSARATVTIERNTAYIAPNQFN